MIRLTLAMLAAAAGMCIFSGCSGQSKTAQAGIQAEKFVEAVLAMDSVAIRSLSDTNVAESVLASIADANAVDSLSFAALQSLLSSMYVTSSEAVLSGKDTMVVNVNFGDSSRVYSSQVTMVREDQSWKVFQMSQAQ